MFVRPNQFRNAKADVQMFYQNGAWTKPVGVSQVYMMLIGGGAVGNNSTVGGGSGNVTTWFGAAQNVPNNLVISPAIPVASTNTAGNSTIISYRGTSLNTLLTASGGNNTGAAPTADTVNTFGNSGFFQSVEGQPGNSLGIAASATTFLSGGGSGSNTTTANYGYSIAAGVNQGFFMLQPIIVACAKSINTSANNQPIGCGGCISSGTAGPGFVLIASW